MIGYQVPHTPPPPLRAEDYLPVAALAVRRYRSKIPGMSPEDVEGEAALALLLCLPKYRDKSRKCRVEAFLFKRITAHLSRLMAQARERVAQIVLLEDEHAKPDRREAEDLAGLARRYLPERQARVIEMTAESWPDDRIAHSLGCSVSAVQTLRSRAVAVLREVLL